MDNITDKIIIRPMYKTDLKYIKGMNVAILESTGEIIKRHFDNVGQYIPKQYSNVPVELLSYNDIDWELAEYKIKK
jgi:hypothetical protein